MEFKPLQLIRHGTCTPSCLSVGGLMLFFVFSALFTPSHAFQPATVWLAMRPTRFSSPSIGQTNVPIDVQPIIGLTGNACQVPSYYEVRLIGMRSSYPCNWIGMKQTTP